MQDHWAREQNAWVLELALLFSIFFLVSKTKTGVTALLVIQECC